MVEIFITKITKMANKPEAIKSKGKNLLGKRSNNRKWLKRNATKAMRLEFRKNLTNFTKDPENFVMPTPLPRFIRGWAD
jgi:hypothetical protein